MSTSTRVEVVVVIGAGSIGQAIARRIGVDKTILLGDVNEDAAAAAAEALQAAGSTRPPQPSMSPSMSPSEHSPIRPLLSVTLCMWCTQRDSLRRRLTRSNHRVELVGVAFVLEEFGRVIAPGGSGVVIASQAGHMIPPLPSEQHQALATTPPTNSGGYRSSNPTS
jgi:threonine dehydrogenase-like Zn-dependent dehydrogenase